jgi:O-antigen/teichoic acid export membrane protein
MPLHDRSLVSAFLSIFGGKMATLVTSVVFTPLLVRLLGSGNYGDYAFLMSVFGLLMVLANSGIAEGLRKYLPEQDSPRWHSRVFGFYARVSFVLCLLVTLPLIALSSVGFFGLIGDDFAAYFRLTAVLVIVSQLAKVVKNTLMALGYEHVSEPLLVVEQFVYSAIALALAYVGYGITGVLLGYIIAMAISVGIGSTFLVKIIDVYGVLRKNVDVPRRQMMLFNVLSIVLSLLMISLYNFDVLLLRPIAGDNQTGYYKSALVVAQFVWIVPIAIQTLLLHSTAQLWNEGDHSTLNMIASRATKYTLVTTTLIIVGLATLADDFIPLYFGADFAVAVTPMILLLPGFLGFAVARPIFAIGQASGRLRVLIIATGSTASLNVILNLLLIPPYGMNGAAVATSIGYGSMAVTYVYAARVIGFDPTNELKLARIAASSLVTLVVLLALDSLVAGRILSLAVLPVIGGIVYSGLIFQTRVVTIKEANQALDELPDPISVFGKRIVGGYERILLS